MKVVFVIPAYNEERNLDKLFSNLSSIMEHTRYPYEIVVVNDGSKDRTREMVETHAEEEPIHLVNHETNLGPGEAFRSGFGKALELTEDFDVIITKEADNTGDYHLLEPMIEKIKGGYELVLASCYAEGGAIEGTTWDRLILSGTANLLLRTLFPMGVSTYSSFFRAYNAGMLRKAMALYGDSFIEEAGFSCMVEILINLHHLGAKMVELPMVLRCQRREGESKMRRLRTMLSLLRLMLKKGIFQRRPPR